MTLTDETPTRPIYRRQRTAVSAAIRIHAGRFIAAPFDASGWQTEPSKDFGPVTQHLAVVRARVRDAFNVSQITVSPWQQ